MVKSCSRAFIFCIFALISILLNGCASTSTAPLPQSLNIVEPSPDIPEEIAAFCGVWKGRWLGLLDTYLVVEEINYNKAKVIYSIGQTYDTPKGGYIYTTADVFPGPTIEWVNNDGNRFIYEMDKSLRKVKAYLIEKATGAKFWAYLERIEIE